jgi:hypothetical protein
MKVLIAIVIIVAAAFGGWQIYSYWVKVRGDETTKENAAQAQIEISGSQLPGLAATLEGSLEAARLKGASGLRQFLIQYGHTISDPRLASIELDYVVLVAQKDPAEAKKFFARVKARTPATSPVYARMKQLEKTYE